jgi:hypothetical protein
VTYWTRVNPILYNRLSFALADINNAVDAEVEFVGRHLDQVRQEFAERWDDLTVRPTGRTTDPRIRWVFGELTAIPALFAVEARIDNDNVIELRNIRIVVDPTIQPLDPQA